MSRHPSFPPGLIAAFAQRRAALFLGAGTSSVGGLPTWNELTRRLAEELDLTASEPGEDFSPHLLAAVPQYYENRFNRRRLIARVRDLIRAEGRTPQRTHIALANLPCDLYYTTNFDAFLEDALRDQGFEFDLVATEDAARDHSERSGRQVRKLHGTLEAAESLILTRSDFAQFERRHPFLTEQLRVDLATHPFLFVGYGLRDPDFNSIYDHVFFNLAPLQQDHYMTVLDASVHEVRDLVKRGIEPIDLGPWGSSNDDRLINFLSALCEATSDALHVGRFFRGVKRGESLPVVVPSRMHESERYLFYPEMDMHVKDGLDKALASVGVTCVRHADRKVLAHADSFLQQNVVLVGSPRGNLLTKYVFDRAEEWASAGRESSITARFVDHGLTRELRDDSRSVSFRVADGAVSEGPGLEYGLIARYRNPWAEGTYIYVLAGLWAMGTYAIGDFLSVLPNFRQLPWAEEDGVVILEATYESHDAYRYEYRLRLLDPGV